MKKNKKENTNPENPIGKSIIFFGFYGLFFILIVMLLRSGYKQNNIKPTKTNSGYGYNFRLTNILNQNYHFIYKEDINNITTIYEGDQLNTTLNYKKSGEVAINYITTNQTTKYKDLNTLSWEKCNNPMIFNKFITPNIMKNILNHSTYTSKTIYIEQEKSSYNYEISTSTLYRILDKTEVDIDDTPNSLTISLDQNGVLKEIVYDLTSYYKYQNPNIYSYKLTLNYSNYGKIKELETP